MSSESSRRAVTGVRSRCPRSATRSRSASSRSSIRSASALRAVASSTVSGGPPTLARAVNSPSRSRWAVAATAVTGVVTRRASWRASRVAPTISSAPIVQIVVMAAGTPRLTCPLGTVAMTTSTPLVVVTGTTASRPWSIVAVKGLPVLACTLDRRPGVVGQARGADQVLVGPHDRHHESRAADRGHRRGEGRVVGDRGDETGDQLGLLASLRLGTVIGQVDDEQAHRDEEPHDDGRGRRGDQQDDPATHQASGAASRTPTPRTLCRYAGAAADSPSLRRNHERCIDGAFPAAVDLVPHRREDLAFGHDLPGRWASMASRSNFAARKLHASAVELGRPRGEVEHETTDDHG